MTLFLYADGQVQDMPASELVFSDGRFARSIILYDEEQPVRRRTFDRYAHHLLGIGRCTVVFIERAMHVGLDERVRAALYRKYVAPKRLPDTFTTRPQGAA
jgi:hypothetical protein